MDIKKRGHIGMQDSTKVRLESFKGAKSFNTIIEEMLDYFEATGLSPRTKIVPLNTLIKEQTNRVIEVSRGIEKSQQTYLREILSLVQAIHKDGIGITAASDQEHFSVDETRELFEHSKQLEKDIKILREENNRLKTLQEVSGKQETSGKKDVKRLREIVETIDDIKKTNSFSPNIYEVDRVRFDEWVKRLKIELAG